MDPKRLTRFVDQDYVRNGSTAFRPGGALPPAHAYLSSLSLKFSSSKGVPFEKLEEGKKRGYKHTPLAPGPPLGEVPTATKPLPDPQDADLLTSGLTASAPMLPRERFMLGHTVQPRVRPPSATDDLPAPDLTKAFEPTDGLMLPSVRRKANALQAERMNAERTRRKLLAEKARTEALMRHRYSSGVLGVDSPAVRESAVYGEAAAAAESKVTKVAKVAARRRQDLLEKSNPIARRGYNIIAPDADPRESLPAAAGEIRPRADAAASGVKIMQAKARAGPREDTYSHIFQSPEIAPQHAARLQFIRNNDTAGRGYNPITGARITHIPPSEPERKHERLAHPSISTFTKTLDR